MVWLGDITGDASPEIVFLTFSTNGANTETHMELNEFGGEAYKPSTSAFDLDYVQLLALNPAQMYFGDDTQEQISADLDFFIDSYFRMQPPFITKADAAYASFLTWYFATRSGSFLPYVALVDLDFDGVAEMALTADVGGTGGVMPLSVLTWNGAAFSEISLPPSISGESAYCDTLERYRNRKSGEEMYVAIGGVHHNNTESEEWIGFSVEDGELRGAPCWKKRTTKPAAA